MSRGASNLALAAALAFSVSFSIVANPITFTYDDRAAFIAWDFKILKGMVHPGEAVRYSYSYALRADCSPPDGDGEIFTSLWFDPQGGEHYTESIQLPSIHKVLTPVSRSYEETSQVIPKTTAPGKYLLQYTATFNCKNSSPQRNPIIERGPLLPVLVLGK